MLKTALMLKLVNNGTPTQKTAKKRVKSSIKTEEKKHEVEESEFDEEIETLAQQYRIELNNNLQTAFSGLIKFTMENPKLKNRLFENDEFPIFLQINTIKMEGGHSKILRIPVKHSIFGSNSEICLIVADVKGIPNKNHDEHLAHYEKLLCDKGVNNIKKIMTFHEFRTEYEQFEMKNKLAELYDAFLVDGKISGKTVSKCGKIFYKKRKVPYTIKLQASKLKEHIQQTLNKTPIYYHSKGDSFSVQVGHSKMTVTQLVENTIYLFKGLDQDFPGGFDNIKSVNLFAYRGLSIPIYTSLRNPNEINLKQKFKDKKVREPVVGELSTKLNSQVSVSATGEVQVKALRKLKRLGKKI